MKILIFLLLFFFNDVINANEFRHWEDWTKEEKIEYGLFTVLNYTDFAQTYFCVKAGNCKELNPILGKTPNDATIAVGFLGGQLIYYYFTGNNIQDRKILFGLKIGIIINNHNQGVKVSKVW